jgi:hypothetical protein
MLFRSSADFPPCSDANFRFLRSFTLLRAASSPDARKFQLHVCLSICLPAWMHSCLPVTRLAKPHADAKEAHALGCKQMPGRHPRAPR